MMAGFFREWSQLHYHSSVFVPESKIDQIIKNAPNPGYASVYRFKIKPDSSVGLSKHEVYADSITLDLDKGDEDLNKAEAILQENDLAYSVWSSGSKGYHVVIPHEDKGSSNYLPYSHLQWVKSLGLPHDPTLYQHGRLIGLPGNVHPKTKKRKTLLYEVEGKPAKLEIVTPPLPPPPSTSYGVKNDLTALRQAALRLASLAVNGPSVGGRHKILWMMAKDMRKAGWCEDTAIDILLSINNSWDDPKRDRDVIKAVKGAYIT